MLDKVRAGVHPLPPTPLNVVLSPSLPPDLDSCCQKKKNQSMFLWMLKKGSHLFFVWLIMNCADYKNTKNAHIFSSL